MWWRELLRLSLSLASPLSPLPPLPPPLTPQTVFTRQWPSHFLGTHPPPFPRRVPIHLHRGPTCVSSIRLSTPTAPLLQLTSVGSMVKERPLKVPVFGNTLVWQSIWSNSYNSISPLVLEPTAKGSRKRKHIQRTASMLMGQFGVCRANRVTRGARNDVTRAVNSRTRQVDFTG